MPGAFPSSASPSPQASLSLATKKSYDVPVNFNDSTPKNGTPIKPDDEEMHPKQHQQSTAKPLEEARWLGFSSMAPHTEPPKHASKIAILQGTPTRTGPSDKSMGSPKFRFTFGREQSLELSPAAKKLMNEKREEANKIRELMIASGDGDDEASETSQRRFAMPKGKKGRFSEVHMEQFKKMDSIAAKASAFRADMSQFKAGVHTTDSQPDSIMIKTKSLKRSPSKAELDGPVANAGSSTRSLPPLPAAGSVTNLPRFNISKLPSSQDSRDSPSPTKRAKKQNNEDLSSGRSSAPSSHKPLPATPELGKMSTKAHNGTDISAFSSPTQASLARASSLKSIKHSKIPGPSFTHLSSTTPKHDKNIGRESSTPLLARSPAKASLFSLLASERKEGRTDALLNRSPIKGSLFKKTAVADEVTAEVVNKTPLLSRSPLKMSVSKIADSEAAEEKVVSSIPLLARSPAKVTLATTDSVADSPDKSTIMGRFNLLRTSPMKSILRSPQRLYSDDPAKIAAGTHLASPADVKLNKNRPIYSVAASLTPSGKRVDFSSSTKARDERSQSDKTSTSPEDTSPSRTRKVKRGSTAQATFVAYPSLPSTAVDKVLTSQQRRQTTAPTDFTFSTHGAGIVFGQSPNAPTTASNSARRSTIRHVSAEPQSAPPLAPATGSKKRKFDFENEHAADTETNGTASDKENEAKETDEGQERAAKRMKPSVRDSAPTKQATRLPTLGVKPKKTSKDGQDGKPKTISKARLNALAQPKRRV